MITWGETILDLPFSLSMKLAVSRGPINKRDYSSLKPFYFTYKYPELSRAPLEAVLVREFSIV